MPISNHARIAYKSLSIGMKKLYSKTIMKMGYEKVSHVDHTASAWLIERFLLLRTLSYST
ncbi:MAG TPA: hypothetical protein ENF42_03655 [Candidatus Bathyarchaeota archaeon]|nr:hypothetical protein [Candidatus Bathyarchaeota archaeon]